jgi:hypothetical protein
MTKGFFPRRPTVTPSIYAYEEPGSAELAGFLKIGFTNGDVRKRVAQQYPTARPGKPPYKIVLEESAMKNDGSSFTDHDVHGLLCKREFINPKTASRSKTEWFKCTVDDVQAAIIAIRNNSDLEVSRTCDFKMRPEQEAAVEKTAAYFASFWKENKKPGKTQGVQRTPHFLWNAKMCFGKTFAAYQLALKMDWKKVLVLTFKPAVQSAWEEDIKTHIDFEGWQFISRNGLSYEQCDRKKPFVCFGSFQDYLGRNALGGIKAKNEWVHATNWDCVILDEYHYGAWRENAKELFESEDDREKKFAEGEGIEYFDEEQMPITTNAYLYLSGTPFRALASGEFIEEQIFNWTYSDEQQAKENWKEPQGFGETTNPYAALPRIVLLTYQLPLAIREIAIKGEYDEFDLNVFFSAQGAGDDACFKYEEYVQKWLDLIRGAFQETTVDNLKLGAKKPPLPFADVQLLENLTHTFWFLPSVSACYAMHNLIKKRNNTFYHNYKIIVAAGSQAGIGVNALPPVRESMTDNPLKSKTITISCGKLTTGVSIKPWTGIFMLRNLTSPETYFQAAFRVQTPWTVKNPDEQSPNREVILKNECYVFDFAPDRALRQIADYACQLNIEEQNPEKKVGEFIKFLPILSYDGFSMRQMDAAAILEMAMTGTAATLLAKRWESALLVNVDNETLSRLMNNQQAMDALMSIEGFRNLNQDIETIINKSGLVKKAKQEANEKEFSAKDKKELSEAEKEFKSKRKEIQEKLIKFATRIPVFMYLTDFREMSLTDVITRIEPELFRKVTGLKVKDFDLLVSLGLFNSAHMNGAVYNFKRYEDSSLVYTGIDKHEGEKVGGWDTVVSRKEYEQIFENKPAW